MDIEPGDDEKDDSDAEVDEVVHDDSNLRDEITRCELKAGLYPSKIR